MIEPTPGPYRVSRYNRPDQLLIESQDGSEIACLTSAEDEVSEQDKADARLLAASWDFFAACRGHHFTDVSRLEWLSAILSEHETLRMASGIAPEDLDAKETMFSECRGLLADLTAAVEKVKGKGYDR